MIEKNQFENRFISYGIIDDEDETEQFLQGAEETAKLFFEEEKDIIANFSSQMYHKELGKQVFEELLLRFAFGFCEGTIFHAIQIISNMLEEGYSDDEIHKVTHASKKRIKSIRNAFGFSE